MNNGIAEPRKKTPWKINEKKALAELRGLSRDARLWLMDRIGNRLNGITNCNALGMTSRVQEAADGLMEDMQRIGLFELQMLRRLNREGAKDAREPCPECGFKFDRPMPYGPQEWHDKQCSTCGRNYNSKEEAK